MNSFDESISLLKKKMKIIICGVSAIMTANKNFLKLSKKITDRFFIK